MFPTCTSSNAIYLGSADIKHLGDLDRAPAGLFQGDNLFGLLIAYLGEAVRFTLSAKAVSAALLLHILHIVVMCAKEEVIGANTPGVVALVKYVKIIRDWPVMKLVTYPMRLKHTPLTLGGYDSVGGISFFGMNSARPLPATRPCTNVTPKPFFQTTTFTRHTKRSYNYDQSQERDKIRSVTANPVAALRGVDAPPGHFISRIIARMC
jgi:hypothetical protein